MILLKVSRAVLRPVDLVNSMIQQYARLLGAVVLICPTGVGLATQTARAQASQVVITGGADETEHAYTWQVRNRSTSRIVRIEFPQYAADTFNTPDEWSQGSQKEMNLVNVGWNYNKSGLCWAVPKADYAGLAPGATATFGMRINAMGALKSTGTVRVKFADGTEAQVAGVELPTQPVKTSPWAALLGPGLIFIIFIIYRERRRKKNEEKEAE